MAVTRTGRALTMTATGDAYTGIAYIEGINFQGTGLTAGQRLLITDTAGGPIADYITEGTSDNADLINGRDACLGYQGVKIAAGTLAGSWTVTIVLG